MDVRREGWGNRRERRQPEIEKRWTRNMDNRRRATEVGAQGWRKEIWTGERK